MAAERFDILVQTERVLVSRSTLDAKGGSSGGYYTDVTAGQSLGGLSYHELRVSLPRFRGHQQPAYMREGVRDGEAQETFVHPRVQG